jgi:hypothetical protein
MSNPRSTAFIILLVVFLQLSNTSAFSQPVSSIVLSNSFLQNISSIFSKNISPEIRKEEQNKREQVKEKLRFLCSQPFSNENVSEIRNLIPELRDVNPTKPTISSPLLFKKWQLLWTTEKEINFFQYWKISKPNSITQTLTQEKIINMIPFEAGGSFGVTGNVNINEELNRVDFEFESATLDLKSWGQFSIPPVGKGFFDVLYLDSELRVDINSRNDILVCTPFKNQE